MPSSRLRWLSVLLNVISLVSIGFIVLTLISRYVWSPFGSGANAGAPDVQADIPDVGATLAPLLSDASHEALTVVVVLEQTCAWNDAAVTFYREITDREDRRYRAVAVTPDPLIVGQATVESLGLRVDNVRRLSLQDIQVGSTPALIVVDRHAQVLRGWLGPLSLTQQLEAFELLEIEATQQDTSYDTVGSLDVRDEIGLRRIPLIDIRPRSSFAQAHIEGFVNIPFDELEIRAAHEIPAHGPTLVYCASCLACETPDEDRVQAVCDAGLSHLKNLGFSGVLVLKDEMPALESARVPVVVKGTP